VTTNWQRKSNVNGLYKIHVTKDKMAYGVTFMDDYFGHRSPTAHAQRHRFGRCNRTLFGRQYTRGGAGIEIICTNSKMLTTYNNCRVRYLVHVYEIEK
jgi:hypothetical protein